MITSVRVDRDGDCRPRAILRSAELAPRVIEHGADHLRIALVSTVALLLAGDDVTVEIDVATDVLVEIVETAATVAYDMRGGSARWRVSARVAGGGALVWRGLPLVVSDGADVDRRTGLELEAGAVALLRETVVLGRSGQRGGRLLLGVDARRPDGRPLLREDLDLSRRDDPVLLGRARVLDTVTLMGARIDRDGADVLHLAEPGTQVRYLGRDLHESPLIAVADDEAARVAANHFQMASTGRPTVETTRKH